MRKSPRIIISRVLIITGAVLIAAALIYEAANYPWKTLYQSPEQLQIDTIPDPTMPRLDEIEVILKEYENEPLYDEETPSEEPAEQSEEPAALDLPGSGDNLAGGIVNKAPVKQEPLVVLGAIKIPKLDVSVNVLEGSSQRELLFGAGHVLGSPQMGRRGNVVISGHRVTARMHPFRHLDKMVAGDIVILKDDQHVYTYETLETFIVGNTETWVMQKVDGLKYGLTLITCHPVGSARQRLILRAQLKDIDGLTPDEFYAPQPSPSPDESGETPEETDGESADPSEPASPTEPADPAASETELLPEIPDVEAPIGVLPVQDAVSAPPSSDASSAPDPTASPSPSGS